MIDDKKLEKRKKSGEKIEKMPRKALEHKREKSGPQRSVVRESKRQKKKSGPQRPGHQKSGPQRPK